MTQNVKYLFHVCEYWRSEYKNKYKYWAVKYKYIASKYKYKYLKCVLEYEYKYQVLQLCPNSTLPKKLSLAPVPLPFTYKWYDLAK